MCSPKRANGYLDVGLETVSKVDRAADSVKTKDMAVFSGFFRTLFHARTHASWRPPICGFPLIYLLLNPFERLVEHHLDFFSAPQQLSATDCWVHMNDHCQISLLHRFDPQQKIIETNGQRLDEHTAGQSDVRSNT